MAAPKHWGYTRDQAFGDEMLVAWADGDLTEILVKEVEERMLRHGEDRRAVAAFARASFDASVPVGRDWIEDVEGGLLAICRDVVQD